jgi:hypothetical protein
VGEIREVGAPLFDGSSLSYVGCWHRRSRVSCTRIATPSRMGGSAEVSQAAEGADGVGARGAPDGARWQDVEIAENDRWGA